MLEKESDFNFGPDVGLFTCEQNKNAFDSIVDEIDDSFKSEDVVAYGKIAYSTMKSNRNKIESHHDGDVVAFAISERRRNRAQERYKKMISIVSEEFDSFSTKLYESTDGLVIPTKDEVLNILETQEILRAELTEEDEQQEEPATSMNRAQRLRAQRLPKKFQLHKKKIIEDYKSIDIMMEFLENEAIKKGNIKRSHVVVTEVFSNELIEKLKKFKTNQLQL